MTELIHTLRGSVASWLVSRQCPRQYPMQETNAASIMRGLLGRVALVDGRLSGSFEFSNEAESGAQEAT